MLGRVFRLPFRLVGIPLDVDVSFLVILPVMAWLIGSRIGALAHAWGIAGAHQLEIGALPFLLGLVAASGLFVCVVLHELGHSITARAFGVKVRSITLWFLGGVAQLEEIPRKAGAEAIVGIAGPIVSILLAAICWGLLVTVPAGPGVTFILAYLAIMNVTLAVFNLIPALPLDGGRILRSLLALFLSYAAATRVASIVSQVLAIAMGIFALITGQWFLLLVAFFIFMSGRAETQTTDVEELLAGALVSDLMTSPAHGVPPELSVEEFSNRVLHEHRHAFPVVDDSEHVLGVVSVRNMVNQPPNAHVAEFMTTPVATVAPAANAAAAYRQMRENNLDLLVVTDSARHLLGILTRMDILRVMRLRSMAAGVFRSRNARPV